MQHFVVIAYNLMIVKVPSNKNTEVWPNGDFSLKHHISLILLNSFYYNPSIFCSWKFENEVIDRYMQYMMRRLHILYQI